jgi:hypothetical protein
MDEAMNSYEQAQGAKKQIAERLRGVRSIRGIGITRDARGDFAVAVNVAVGSSGDVRRLLPAEVDGVGVEVREVSKISILPLEP